MSDFVGKPEDLVHIYGKRAVLQADLVVYKFDTTPDEAFDRYIDMVGLVCFLMKLNLADIV